MKKIVTILMAVLLVFGAVACKPATTAEESTGYKVVSLVNGILGD